MVFHIQPQGKAIGNQELKIVDLARCIDVRHFGANVIELQRAGIAQVEAVGKVPIPGVVTGRYRQAVASFVINTASVPVADAPALVSAPAVQRLSPEPLVTVGVPRELCIGSPLRTIEVPRGLAKRNVDERKARTEAYIVGTADDRYVFYDARVETAEWSVGVGTHGKPRCSIQCRSDLTIAIAADPRVRDHR